MRLVPLSFLLLAALAPAGARAQAGRTTVTVEPPPAGASDGSALPTADEAFGKRVRAVEAQVVDLEEKVARTKARLLLLQETALGGDLGTSARARLVHRNEMGDGVVLESVSFALDGQPVFAQVDDGDGALGKRQELEVFNGRLAPGTHLVSVRLVYRGKGGAFKKHEGQRFRVQSSYTFQAEGGKLTRVRVVGFDKGGDPKERPAVRYDVEVSQDGSGPAAAGSR